MNAVEIIKYMESKYPKELAYEWDNVGLQVGTLNQVTKKVLVTLDVTKEVIKEAIHKKADLIISHHPLMFKPVNSIVFDTPKGWMLKNLVKNNISVYSAHTNFDQAEGGMNDILAEAMNIKNTKLLDEEVNIGRYGEIEEVKITDFVKQLKETFGLTTVKLIGSDTKKVKTVGVSGGSGSHHMYQARMKGCDVYITGDVTYHTALDAVQLGITLIDVGHHVEKIFVSAVKKDLENKFPDVEFIESEVNTNPYKEI